MKRISVLGSTGSIGTQTLEIAAANPRSFEVVSLAAGHRIDKLKEQITTFKPRYVSVATETLAAKLRDELPFKVEIGFGEQGLIAAASQADADLVVTGIVGSRGLAPTLAAIEAGADIALANKETLVTAGHLVMEKARRAGVNIIPVDSEHSAIFQCLQGERSAAVRRIILTASGGAFRDRSREELKKVTPEDALRHPNWEMGAKVTIDSATMMNKGLEVIEAHWLFSLPFSQIDVLIHRESIVHSMVEFKDKAVMAQLGTPDMKVPIQYAMTYPERLPLASEPLNLAEIGSLHFEEPSFDRYPCLKWAYECGKQGGTAPAVLNAANEAAVQYFLSGAISFLDIEGMLERVLDQHENVSQPELQDIMEKDAWARERVRQWVEKEYNMS